MRISALSGVALGAALAASGLLAAPAFAQADQTPVAGGTTIVVLGSEPPGLSPGVSTNNPIMVVGCMIYQGLVQLSDQGVVEPLLAKSWTVSDDGLTYEFELNEVNWQDGVPFTADDVAYSLTEISAKYAPLFSAQLKGVLKSVEAISPHQVKVTLNTPFGPFLRMLSCSNGGAIHPAHLYAGTDVMTNEATVNSPIGTGPFKLTEWRRGDFLRLEKSEQYWEEGKPYLDSIIVKIIPDSAARTQSLISGESDFIGSYFLAASDIETLKANPNIRLEVEGGPPNMALAFFNLDKAPMNDVRVRQALMTATDRSFIQRTAFSGQGLPGTAPFARQLAWVSNPDIDYDVMYAYDPAKAAQMLDEAGYPAGPDGTRFTLRFAYDTGVAEREKTGAAIQDMWRQIGVKVELETTEQAIMLPKVFKDRDFDVYFQSYSTYGDPAVGIARAFVTSSIGNNFGNASGYSNPEVDALFKQGAEATAMEDRAAAYRAVQVILANDLPALTIHSNKGYDAVSTKLHGVWGGEGNGRWNNAWLSQ